jgi:hypothetical protein
MQRDRRTVADVTGALFMLARVRWRIHATMGSIFIPDCVRRTACDSHFRMSRLLTDSRRRAPGRRDPAGAITKDRLSDSRIRLYSGVRLRVPLIIAAFGGISATSTANYLAVWLPSLTTSLRFLAAPRVHQQLRLPVVRTPSRKLIPVVQRRMDVSAGGSFIGQHEILICPEG